MKITARADIPGLVELQLLRHGPPHNQLLSPLTDYLALCGDHPNTTLRIPLEHGALETRLRALRYFDSEQTRMDQLRETARIAAELLAKVPGLIAELSADRGDGAPFVHLSIVSRASELALFPFELAVSPDGMPGAGQSLCLQKQMPICLTRRSRNIRNNHFVWDRPIKILMVASDAGGEIPLLQHFALLRKLVDPWVGAMPIDVNDDEDPRLEVHSVLRLLTHANVEMIAETLANEVDRTGNPFTHIHVLAHGADLPETDRRSGIALHHPTRPGEIDVVDGKRLALTLGCLPDYPEEANRYQGPAVVTLATCGSADQGGVKISGASLAFELHDSGIPLVVGSQFPLTTEGSIIMTEALYSGFLVGGDPRSTIWEARRALLANLSQAPGAAESALRSAHDWASMTVYAALPDNLDHVLPAHWSKRNELRLHKWLRQMGRQMGLQTRQYFADPDAYEQWRDMARSAADEAIEFARWTRTLAHVDETIRVANSGILASAQKQIGLSYLRTACEMNADWGNADEQPADWAESGEKWLRESRNEYRRVFDIARHKTWALVQILSLDLILKGDYSLGDWTTANQLATFDQYSMDPPRCVDALTALLELELLAWLRAGLQGQSPTVLATTQDLAERVRNIYREKRDLRDAVRAAKRQFKRYLTDFAELAYFARQTPDVADAKKRLEGRLKLRSARRPADRVLKGTPGEALAAIRDLLQTFAEVEVN